MSGHHQQLGGDTAREITCPLCGETCPNVSLPEHIDGDCGGGVNG